MGTTEREHSQHGAVGSAVSLARALDVLDDERRRATIRVLARGGIEEPVSVADLARHVASYQYDAEPSTVPENRWRAVYTALHQRHVTKLEEVGAVERDTVENTVRRGEYFATFENVLVNLSGQFSTDEDVSGNDDRRQGECV